MNDLNIKADPVHIQLFKENRRTVCTLRLGAGIKRKREPTNQELEGMANLILDLAKKPRTGKVSHKGSTGILHKQKDQKIAKFKREGPFSNGPLPILPMILKWGPNKSRIMRCMLDDGSTAPVLSLALCEALGIPFIKRDKPLPILDFGGKEKADTGLYFTVPFELQHQQIMICSRDFGGTPGPPSHSQPSPGASRHGGTLCGMGGSAGSLLEPPGGDFGVS